MSETEPGEGQKEHLKEQLSKRLYQQFFQQGITSWIGESYFSLFDALAEENKGEPFVPIDPETINMFVEGLMDAGITNPYEVIGEDVIRKKAVDDAKSYFDSIKGMLDDYAKLELSSDRNVLAKKRAEIKRVVEEKIDSLVPYM